MTNNKTTLNDILENPQKPIEEMFIEKQEFIKKQAKSKQDSITEAAIRRDSALFASVEDGPKDQQSLKKKLNYWMIYFSDLYQGENGDE